MPKQYQLFLSKNKKVKRVFYPGCEDHPQHEIAKKYYKGYSAILSFELTDEINVVEFLDHLNVIIPATHLGDVRTLAIPVAKTIFFEMGAAKRREAGISENLIRLSIGIEDSQDILKDLDQAISLS